MKKLWARLFKKNARLSIPSTATKSHVLDLNSTGPILDLDAIIEKPVYFRLHGRIMHIKPIELEQFVGLAQGFASLQNMASRDDLTGGELAILYFDLFSKVVPEITKEDVDEMTQAQCAALFTSIIHKIEGRPMDTVKNELEAEKKKAQSSQAPNAKSK